MAEGNRRVLSSVPWDSTDRNRPCRYALGAASFYNGSELVQEANNEVVVVVIQYRLGLFGIAQSS